MVTEVIAAVAVSGALVGAALNCVRAWYQANEPFSFKKFAGGLISSMIPALAVVNFVNLDSQASLGIVALFVSQALAGAGASTLLSKVHEETPSK